MNGRKKYFALTSHFARLFVVLFMGMLIASVSTRAEVNGSQRDGAAMVEDSCVVTGCVVDEDGEPVVGALVNEMNAPADRFVISDFDGNYRIVLQKSDSPIVFSCLGFRQTIVTKEHSKRVVLTDSNGKKLVIIK